VTVAHGPDAPIRTVLHLAPHPDDELIGAPATLMALRDAGWKVVNLALSLGAQSEKARREKELREACRRAGFELRVADLPLHGHLTGPPGPLGVTEALGAQRAIEEAIIGAFVADPPDVLVAPSPQDGHPGHEIVGRATVEVCERLGASPPPLWLWGLWADLPFPTVVVGFDEARMQEVLDSLDAHAGEIARNDYRRMLRGRAQMNSSLGPERVFGFGSSAGEAEGSSNVELLCEVLLVDGEWLLGRPRWLDPADPLAMAQPDAAPSPGRPITGWLHGPSPAAIYGRPGE